MRYEIRREGSEYAIFDENGNQISQLFDEIYPYGLVEGKSEYYIVKKGSVFDRYAIFHKDGDCISGWHRKIIPDGLINGQSEYYLALTDEMFWVIFDVNGRQISDTFEDIYPDGLVRGESEYYIARRDEKEAIFDKDGNQITEWFDSVYPYGLVKGECDYYVGCNRGDCTIYHKSGVIASPDFPEEYLDKSEVRFRMGDTFGSLNFDKKYSKESYFVIFKCDIGQVKGLNYLTLLNI